MIQGSDYERVEMQPRIIAPVTEPSYSYISMVAHAATTMNPTCALILERFSIAFTANGKRQAEISRLPKTREIYVVSAYILPVSHSYGASTKNREIS